MSATLTSEQISLLYLRSSNTVILKKDLHQNNLKLQLQPYKRCKQDVHDLHASDDNDDD